jgi:hypothetical protein
VVLAVAARVDLAARYSAAVGRVRVRALEDMHEVREGRRQVSYCRKSDTSDVYVIRHFDGKWECFCSEKNTVFSTRTDAISHLQQHVARGHRVPQRAFDRLVRERAAVGETGWISVADLPAVEQ